MDARTAGVLCFVVSLAAAVVIRLVASLEVLPAYVIAINLGALTLMAVDKAAARRSHPRVPERTLWGFAALGGGGGILAGMRLFRHKTRKASFQFWLILILAAQVLLLLQLLRP